MLFKNINKMRYQKILLGNQKLHNQTWQPSWISDRGNGNNSGSRPINAYLDQICFHSIQHCTDKGSHGSNLQSWSSCYRVLDRDWGFTESLTMDNSVKRVWRVPRSLHAKDLFFEFYKRVNAL